MTLSSAKKRIEASILARWDTSVSGEEVEITSGGVREDGREPHTALFLSERFAIDAWERQVLRFLLKNRIDRCRWSLQPCLDTMQMRETDLRFGERIVRNRYAVSAKITFTRVTTDAA
jgi:hypothetical protein